MDDEVEETTDEKPVEETEKPEIKTDEVIDEDGE